MNLEEARVYIDSSSDLLYSSYYIQGLYSVFGRQRVHYSSRYFKSFKHSNHFFAFVVIDKDEEKKVVVDFTDSKLIDDKALGWCDVYGKINLAFNSVSSDKIVAIGPSFGIKIYNLFETLWYCGLNLIKAYNRIPNKRKFMSDYKAQFKRPKLESYSPEPSHERDVFFMASIWKQEQATNRYRANFIKSCRSYPLIDFEGGFAPRRHNDVSGFEALTTDSRVDMSVYLERIKQSAVVFNTPAVKDCHGWKLAEYLCLGKAIISTPLLRVMPKPLIDGVHFLITDGSVSGIENALNTLFGSKALRRSLEASSLEYFNKELAPERVIKRLLNFN